MAGGVGSIVASEDWTQVRAAIVAVLAEEGRRLKQFDESLVLGANGARMRNGDVSCWLTISRRGAPDPHLEIAVDVAGMPGSGRMGVDIATFQGEVLAELEADDQARTVEEMAGRLRQFLDHNADLLQRLATA
jgi:hypothetical protein